MVIESNLKQILGNKCKKKNFFYPLDFKLKDLFAEQNLRN